MKPRDHAEARPRAVKTTVVLLAYGAVLVLGAVFGGLSVIQLRSTTDKLEAVISKSARIVIEVERLHATNDHLGMVARGYLLTQNDKFLVESQARAQEFRERLRDLEQQLEGTEAARTLARVRELDARGQEQREYLFTARGQTSDEAVESLFEQRAQFLRDRVSAMLEELSRVQEAALGVATREAQVAVNHAMQILGGLAVVGALLAAGLTIALVRTLRLVARGRVALEESHAQLARANQDLDAFAGRIAHDLRNMISPLELLADTLGQGTADERTVQRAAERLHRLVRNADGLIGGLLDFARAGGQPPGTPASAPVAEVIRDVVADLASLASSRQASVQVEVEDVSVRCARSLLQTVLMNLVGNAVKYLEGAQQRMVHVSARAVGKLCEITVADTGPGIPADALDSIFEPFYRVPGVAPPGMGIGLATVQRIVEAHHGHVSVRSRVGEGSNFAVVLPLADPAGQG